MWPDCMSVVWCVLGGVAGTWCCPMSKESSVLVPVPVAHPGPGLGPGVSWSVLGASTLRSVLGDNGRVLDLHLLTDRTAVGRGADVEFLPPLKERGREKKGEDKKEDGEESPSSPISSGVLGL